MNRLHPALRATLYAVLVLLVLSGALWEAGFARAMLIKVHGAAAMASLVALGALLARHVACGWAAKKNRMTGVVMLAALLWLVVSGYLLYYAGDEGLRAYASQTHFWVGLALAGMFALHQGRQARNAGR
jgi:hypothetical protein